VPAICAFGAVAVVAISNGGYETLTWRLSSIAMLALAAAALIVRDRIAFGRFEWMMLLGLAGLAAWIELSQFWSDNPSETLPEAERAIVYVSVVAAVLLGAERSELLQSAAGALAGVTLGILVGLIPYLFSPVPLNPIEGKLLFKPLGYANGVGIFAVLGIVLSVGLALAARSRWVRAVALAPLVALVPALYFTSSRGAWVALAAGLIATLYLGRRIRAKTLLGLLAVAVAAGLLLGSSRGQGFSLFGENRPHYWHVAWQDYKAHPVLGSGAGTYVDYWLHHRPNQEFVRDAHNLYLESLAELGPLGLGLLAVALAVPLAALRGRQNAVVAALAGAYVAFLVHAAVDWDWELPAVTLTGFLCGAAALVGAARPEPRALRLPARLLLLVLVLAVGVFTLVRLKNAGGFTGL
jgi:O-antigen ligase